MTVICAAKTSNGVWISSDSQTTCNSQKRYVIDGKWVTGKYYAIGIAGDGVLKNIIDEHTEHGMLDDEKLSPWNIAQLIKDLLVEYNFDPDVNQGSTPTFNSTLILATHNDIWHIDASFHVLRIDEFIACGSGSEFSTGAYWALTNRTLNQDIGEAIQIATKAACEHSIYCGGPIWSKFLSKT